MKAFEDVFSVMLMESRQLISLRAKLADEARERRR